VESWLLCVLYPNAMEIWLLRLLYQGKHCDGVLAFSPMGSEPSPTRVFETKYAKRLLGSELVIKLCIPRSASINKPQSSLILADGEW
jgi:hypothetical protein